MFHSRKNLFVVLVRSKYSRNIGAAARASANMGVSRLFLVEPKCKIESEARMAAAGAQEMLQNTKTYSDLTTLFKTEPDGLRIALTRRPGKLRQNEILPNLLDKISSEGTHTDLSNIYLIFGPEDHGLSNLDMELSHCRCALPIFGDFYSLNLSQAVLLACSIVQQKWRAQSPINNNKAEAIASTFPEETIKEWLLTLGFNLSAQKNNAFVVLRRLLLSSIPTEKEISVLNSVVQQTIRILKSSKK